MLEHKKRPVHLRKEQEEDRRWELAAISVPASPLLAAAAAAAALRAALEAAAPAEVAPAAEAVSAA